MKKATIFIWDLDNVLYKWEKNKFVDLYINAVAESFATVDPTIPIHETTNRARAFILEQGLFKHDILVKEYQLDQKIVHELIHDNIPTDFLSPNEILKQEFLKVEATHCILSHGSVNWAKRVLDTVGIKEFFKDQNIFGLERVNFIEKTKGKDPFQMVLGHFGVNPEQAIFIDDSHANLKHAKELGIQTVHINYGKTIVCDTVDHAFETAEHFIQEYNRKQQLLKNYPPKNGQGLSHSL